MLLQSLRNAPQLMCRLTSGEREMWSDVRWLVQTFRQPPKMVLKVNIVLIDCSDFTARKKMQNDLMGNFTLEGGGF